MPGVLARTEQKGRELHHNVVSKAPEVFLGAATQRTKNIRLGHGIVQLTTNHPHRVAERVSTLDLMSRGRVELGLGEGAGPGYHAV